jgi:tubulin monoglycylase TTLL3/8
MDNNHQYGDEEDDYEDDGFKSPDNEKAVSKEDSKKYPYMNIVLELLAQLKKKYPQYDINGHRNTWILKPGGKSRGRGIKCFRSYEKIMQHIRKIKAR